MKKSLRLLTSSIVGLALLGSAGTASATLIAYDNLDSYGSGSELNGLDGGTGWTGAWGTGPSSGQNSGTVNAGGLAFPGVSAGGGNHATVDARIAGTTGIGRPLPQNFDSGSLYFSYLTEKIADTDRSLNVSFFSGGSEQFAFGQTAPNDVAGFGTLAVIMEGGARAHVADSPVDYALNEVFFVVGRIDINPEGDSDVSIYLNPDPGAEEASLTPYIQFSDPFSDGFAGIDAFRMFAGGTSGDFTSSAGNFDEFRFGDDYGSVIPEPSTYAVIFGALALAFAAFRRRSRR